MSHLPEEAALIGVEGLQALVDELGRRGYEVVGPTIRQGAIVFDRVTSDLPAG